MSKADVYLTIKVTTTAGYTTNHTYDLPSDPEEAAKVYGPLISAILDAMYGRNPTLILSTPLGVYNPKQVVSIHIEPPPQIMIERVMGFLNP